MPAQSSFDVGQENLFTIFEMAPGEGGIPGGNMEMAGSTAGVEDYNFTDDFDAGGAEYGVDENVLDLSGAEAEGFGTGPVSEPISADDFEFNTSGMDDAPSRDNAGPDDFELNLNEDLPAVNETVATETPEPETDVDNSIEFTGGFDEVEGLGFGFDETPAEETPDVTPEEVSLDAALEPEISLEPELELAEEEPSLEVSAEPELDILDIADEQPSLELSEDPSMDLPEELAEDAGELNVVEEEPSVGLPDDLDLAEEPELMEPAADEYAETEDDGGIEFDLDSVDLDEAEEVTYVEEPEAETSGEESLMDLEGLEMENPEEPEDEDLTK